MASQPANSRTPGADTTTAPRASQARPIRLLIGCAILLVTTIAAGTAVAILNLRDRALVNSEREQGNVALVLAAQTDRAFQSVELVQKNIIERIQSLGIASREEFGRRMSGHDVQLLLKDRISALSFVAAIYLTDRDGKLVNISHSRPGMDLNVAERDYFTALKSDAQLISSVSAPHFNQATGTWNTLLARKFLAPDGEFLGVVGVAVELQYFEKLFSSIVFSEHGSIAIVRNDGMLIVRYPRIESALGRIFTGTTDALGSRDRASVRLVGRMDGKDRLLVAHRMAHYPLFVSVGIDIDAALAGWRQEAILLAGEGIVAVLMVALFVFSIVRQLLQGRRRFQQELGDQRLQLDTAVANMSQGLLMFDSSGRLSLCTRRYLDMYGLSPDMVKPGCTIRELIRHRKDTGSFSGDVEQYCASLEADIAQGKIASRVLETTGGRSIHIVDQPIATGGWVSTHEDITKQRKTEQERDRALEFLDVIIDNIPVMIAVKDARTREFILLNRAGETLLGLGRTAAIGKTPYEIFPKAQADLITAQDERSLQSDSPVALEDHPNLARPDDGRVCSSKRLIIRDDAGKPRYLVSLVEDVTERHRAQKDRDQNRKFLDLVVENVPTAIFVKDAREKRYVLINQAGEKLWGMPRDHFIGKTAHEIFPKISADKIAGLDDRLMESTEPILEEFSITTPDQSTRNVVAKKLAIFDDKGEPQYLLAVVDDVTERKQAEARIVHMAHHDALTGLPNRVLLHDRLQQELSFVRRGGKLAVLCLDLDQFKSVNDTLGHSTGDELLKAVAARLRGCLRETDLIARLGGDEFAIVRVGLRRPSEAAILAQRLRDAITRQPFELNGHHIAVDGSIGIALAPNDGTDVGQLLKCSDLALYGAKSDGRGTFRYFEPDMDARMKARRKLELDLRKALTKGEFELYYQPIVNLERDTISGCEALLRWHHPESGMIAPAKFIPVAEESGLIIPIGEWALRQACKDAATWPDDIKVAVNISPAQFRSKNLVQVAISALAASGLPSNRLELEITESVLMQDNETTLNTLHQLREIGVRIAMDDFGTGYSSLSYLRSFPFDKIKIDRAFIHGLMDDDGSIPIVRAIIDLANSLDMMTTAEGIETQEQLDIVRIEGCQEIQGYLISPPRPVADVLPLLLSRAAQQANVA